MWTVSSYRTIGAFLLLLILAAGGPAATHAACVGDCDGDGSVTIDELVRGVNIVLGSAPVGWCWAFDCGGGDVTVDCLVRGVNAVLGGCPMSEGEPVVSGPVTGGLGQPFAATTSFDLAGVGYAQVEYFVAGTANAFVNVGALGADGRWTVAPGEQAGYRTRLLVYRPIDAADFNGTVVVEWLNVSGGLDAGPDWLAAHTELIREGYAWVGVSAQVVGVEGGEPLAGVVRLPLKTVDPERYGSLSHPGDSFSYDIFTQAARAVRSSSGIRPLGDLRVERMLGIGESQSAFRLVVYINAIHPRGRLFDGYLVHSRGGFGFPLSEAPQPPIGTPGETRIRDDLDVPVMIFQTENDLTFLNYVAARQPDSGRLRVWEVAGTAHADTYTLAVGMTDKGDDPSVANLVITSTPLPGLIECGAPVNSGPQHWVLKAAIAGLNRWVRDGVAPPVAAPLEVDAGPPVTLVRDAYGNALGGVRTPQVDVPIAVLSGEAPEGALLCTLFGTTVPFDEPTLLALYPDRAAYRAAFDAATDAAVAAGFILPADAALMKAAAATAPIPN
jgi:hypothetical protein